jgi:hypothetical protein
MIGRWPVRGWLPGSRSPSCPRRPVVREGNQGGTVARMVFHPHLVLCPTPVVQHGIHPHQCASCGAARLPRTHTRPRDMTPSHRTLGGRPSGRGFRRSGAWARARRRGSIQITLGVVSTQPPASTSYTTNFRRRPSTSGVAGLDHMRTSPALMSCPVSVYRGDVESAGHRASPTRGSPPPPPPPPPPHGASSSVPDAGAHALRTYFPAGLERHAAAVAPPIPETDIGSFVLSERAGSPSGG